MKRHHILFKEHLSLRFFFIKNKYIQKMNIVESISKSRSSGPR